VDRAKLDNNPTLLEFTEKLEAACIGVVEAGKMTKDLALILHGSKYVTYQLFTGVVTTPKAFSFLLDMIKLTLFSVILATRLSREHYLNTEEFIDAVAAELKTKISA
ncbi:isocitrate dehydrogenase, partial [Trifolium pratense]